MSEGHSGSHAKSGSVGSSRGSTWWERRQKGREDRERERVEGQSGLGEGLYQTLRMVSGAMGYDQHEERDQEIERLRRLVRDFELEERNRRQRRNQDNRERRDNNVGNRDDGESSRTSPHQRQDHSRESRRKRTQFNSKGPH